MDIRQVISENPDLQRLLFVRGFLLTDNVNIDTADFPFCGSWKTVDFENGYYAVLHNLTGFTKIVRNNKIFFLFGHAYNPFTMEYKEETILEHIADNFGKDSFQDSIDELTGIFLFGYFNGDSLRFISDPSGKQSSCCGIIDNHFYLASHAQLIGDICDLKMTDFVKELVSYRWYSRVMGAYLPADLTPYSEVKRIVPNILYSYSGNKISHKRFYPLKDIDVCYDEADYQSVIEQGADILKNSMALIPKKWSAPAISLTGGIDSNTTFAAANGNYDKFTAFSYCSAEKETIDCEAAQKIANAFNVPWKLYAIPDTNDNLDRFYEKVAIIVHNNGYIDRAPENELRKRIYLEENFEGADVEVKSWASEIIRAYWNKYYGKKNLPGLSAKSFRNYYKLFFTNRILAHKVDRVFEKYIIDYEYDKIPLMYPPADMHCWEVTESSKCGMDISEMKMYSDITIIYNNRKFFDLMFKVPFEKRLSDQHHLDMKKYLNKELYDMNSRVKNMKETQFRANMFNLEFTVNSILP
ncbi:MAG: hypothetical protein IJS03_06920 [Eubacterium sp.]|nr:hypothetical protein [Eubacterium sp.]